MKSSGSCSFIITSGKKIFPWLFFVILFYSSLELSLLFISLSKWPKAGKHIVNEKLHPLVVPEQDTKENTTHTLQGKQNLLLFVAVLNKVTAFDRRDAVRSTWMSRCRKHSRKLACFFFTDTTESLSKVNRTRVENEKSLHQDMLFMPYKGGNNFALRLVWMLKWAATHYNFDFFLRIDDDHFLCLDRLVYELPHRPRNSLYWGFIHCREDIVRVDEGWMILSGNLVQEVLSKVNTTLPCHPFGDQAVALWMLDSKYNVTYFYDNDRVVNFATSYDLEKYNRPDICTKYLSLHGSYPKTMKMYWNISSYIENLLADKPTHYEIPPIPRYDDKCRFSNKVFDVNKFWPQLRFNTKPCKDDPRWTNSNEEFHSRETYGEDI